MLYTFSRANIEPDCPASFVSDTNVKLLEQVRRHIDAVHQQPPSLPREAERGDRGDVGLEEVTRSPRPA